MKTRTIIAALTVAATTLAGAAAAENKILVTNGNDDGAGSLRVALEFAARQREASQILIATRDDISLNSPLVYDGTAPLALIGAGQSLIGQPGTDILTVTRGIDLTIRGLQMPGMSQGDASAPQIRGVLVRFDAPGTTAAATDTSAI